MLARGTLTGLCDKARYAFYSRFSAGSCSGMDQTMKGFTVADLTWLAVLVGLTVLTLGFLRLCDAS